MPNAPGSMTLDLKGLCTISSMRLLLWDLEDRYYRYKIEASSDNTTTSDVDHDRGPDGGDERVSELAGHRLQSADPSAVLAADRHVRQR